MAPLIGWVNIRPMVCDSPSAHAKRAFLGRLFKSSIVATPDGQRETVQLFSNGTDLTLDVILETSSLAPVL